MNEYNTLALAYTNDKGEVVAWSSDTFGTSDKYPKTYLDSERNREMLSRKGKNREEFSRKTADLLSGYNTFAGALMSASIEADNKFFAENKITGSALATLELYTDYSRGVDLPKWEQVVDCVDNKKYKLEN